MAEHLYHVTFLDRQTPPTNIFGELSVQGESYVFKHQGEIAVAVPCNAVLYVKLEINAVDEKSG
jgi:hypothetical protein